VPGMLSSITISGLWSCSLGAGFGVATGPVVDLGVDGVDVVGVLLPTEDNREVVLLLIGVLLTAEPTKETLELPLMEVLLDAAEIPLPAEAVNGMPLLRMDVGFVTGFSPGAAAWLIVLAVCLTGIVDFAEGALRLDTVFAGAPVGASAGLGAFAGSILA
jgi:hypothetical protein